MIKQVLVDCRFWESSSDACVILKKDLIVFVYINDCILVGKNGSILAKFIKALQDGPKNFIFTDKGKLNKYLEVKITKEPDGNSFALMQPFLIKRILKAAEIDLHMTNSQPTPVAGPLISKEIDGPERKHDWKYWTLTGMLGYLQQTSQP